MVPVLPGSPAASWVPAGCQRLCYPPRTPAMGTTGQAAAPSYVGDSRGCRGAVPVSSGLTALHQEPVAGRGGAFRFLRCLYLGGNQLPFILASPRCELAGPVALCASPWMSLSAPPVLGLLGACAPCSNSPPLANHLLAKLVINSFAGSLGKPGWASTRCLRVPCQRDVLWAIATMAWAITTAAQRDLHQGRDTQQRDMMAQPPG